jgi:NitT/TauT family transport system substrate-binding protein
VKRVIRQATGLLLFLVVLMACAKREQSTLPDEVTLQLKWFHQAQFAGFYVAQDRGYYTDENLRVRFLEGGPDIDAAQSVVSGLADFAVVAPEDILIKRSQGKPVAAIAAIYRRSAVVFVSMADSGITCPFDFMGKRVAVAGPAGAIRDLKLQFDALMNKLQLDVSNVELVPYDPQYAAFLKGQADVTPGYLTGGVVKMRQQGVRLNLIWPGDYGVRFYSDTVMTSERMVDQKAAVVTRFLRATLKGWRVAVGDPEAAVAVVLKYVRSPDANLQEAMMQALVPLVHTGEDHIGWMKAEDWREMRRVLLDEGVIAAPVADLSKAYTLRFLEAVYGGPTR